MKRLICLLTVLCMVASMAGFTAFAEGSVISEVTFEGTLPEIKAGDALPAADESGMERVTGISCPALEADYELDAYWLKNSSSDVTDTVFEKAKYQLYINLYPKAGNESTVTFAEDIVINGLGDREWNAYCSNQLSVFVEYDLRENGGLISEISVTGITAAEIGKTADVSGIKIPEDANYTLEANWATRSTGDVFTGTFGKDSYNLWLTFEPKEGYTFDGDIQLVVDGETIEDIDTRSAYEVIQYFTTDLRDAITSVSVTGIPTAEVGKIADVSGIKVPENANYIVEAYWWDLEAGEEFTGTFEQKEYELHIAFWPKDDCYVAEDVQLIMDGKTINSFDYYSDSDGLYWMTVADLREQIVQVEVNNFPALTLGEKLPTPEVKIPENAPYKIVKQEWSRGNGEVLETLEAAEKDVYTLRIQLEMLETAVADEYGISVKADGEILRSYSSEDGWSYDYSSYSGMVTIWKMYELRDLIETVQVTGVPEVVGGKPMDASDVKIPENVNYELADAWFYGPNEDETFLVGQEYTLVVELHAKDGFRFSEDLVATVDGGYWDNVDVEGNMVYFHKVYQTPGGETNNTISEIEVVGVPVLEAGKVPDFSKVAAPEGANYTIANVSLANEYGEWIETAPEKGKAYTIYFDVACKEGYEFTEVVDLYVNGEYVDTSRSFGDFATLAHRVSLKTKIEKITLNSTVEVKVGESSVTTDVTIAEGSVGKIREVRWAKWDYNRGTYVDFNGVFEAGNVYSQEILVEIPEGHELAEMFRFNLNGVDTDWESYYYENVYLCRREFSLENKEITEINLVITPPEVGKPYNEKNIQVSDGAPCYILWKSWYNYDPETNDTNVFLGDTHYSADLTLTPEAGYVFADDVKVTVNGKNADVTVAGITCLTLDLWSHFNTSVQEDGTVAIRDGKIEELLNRAGENATEITLDLSGMDQTSSKVVFAAYNLYELAEEKVTLTVVTDTATVTLDAKTIETIIKAAGDESLVTLEVKYIEQTVLTENQKASLQGKKVAGVISAQLLLDGVPLADFGGGNVTIRIPFAVTEGTDINGYALWYLADDGSFTEQKATFAENMITTVMAHFSEYVVLYTEPTPPAANPSTGDEFPVAAFVVIAVMSVLGMAVVAAARKRSAR